MKPFLCLLLSGLPVVASASSARPVRSVDDSVRAVANASLPGFLAAVPAGQESKYGFPGRDEFERATTGDPIEVFTTSATLGDSLPWKSDTAWNRPVALGRWRVPVRVGDRTRCFLTVERVEGTWTAVDLGAAGLAQEMADFDRTHPGKRRALLRLEALRADVALLDRKGTGWDSGEYHPLRSARSFFPSDSARPAGRAELFGNLHRLYREHRPAGR